MTDDDGEDPAKMKPPRALAHWGTPHLTSIGIIICDECKLRGKANGGDDILCQYLQTSRALVACSICYECLGIGKFPVKEIQVREEEAKRQLEDDYSNLGLK
jgi:hypothetical protein